MLEAAGYRFEVVRPSATEKFLGTLSPGELTLLNAVRKGRSVARLYPKSVVLAADTLVSLNGETIGKPINIHAAGAMLTRLSGRTHQVYSAVFIGHLARNKSTFFCEISDVRFRRLSQSRIRDYLARINPLDKAGAYAAQGHGAEIIAYIRGSYSNVVGLPMERIVPVLQRFGITP